MKRKRFRVLMAAGILCLAGAVGLTLYNVLDEQRAAESAKTGVELLHSMIPDPQPETVVTPVPQPQVVMTTVSLEGRNYVGILEIPALDLELPILENWSEELLKYAPCLYQGTISEGMIIAGHNYRSHFGGLGRLGIGDDICFTDVDGTRWNYTVTTTEVIPGSDVEAMTSGGWDLTLFTCTYGGQERYTVRATLTTHG